MYPRGDHPIHNAPDFLIAAVCAVFMRPFVTRRSQDR
jgi:hypothetical protein